jgi:hypothetical protein
VSEGGVPLVAAVVAALALLVLGILFLFKPDFGIALSGHHADLLMPVLGGRYLALAAAIAAFAVLRDHRGLAVLFSIGAGLGLIDSLIVFSNAMGQLAPHLVAFAASLGLAAWFARLPIARAS